MAWTKYSNVARDRHGSVLSNVRIIVDYNSSTKDRTSALLEINEWSNGSGDSLTINASTDTDDFTITEGTDFNAEDSDAKTAENIASAIGALTNYSTSATGTGASGSSFVSVYYSNGHIDGTSTTDSSSGDSDAWSWYTINGVNGAIARLASDDSPTTKHQPIYTDSNGAFFFYVDAPVDIDIQAMRSGKTFNNTYTEDITVAT